MNKRAMLLAAALVAPALATAPRRDGHTTVDEVVARARAGGDTGWALVDRATAMVHEGYRHHSLWHLWESPSASLAAGRGWSAQYNQALGEVLRRLGFDVQVVHAARVRGLGHNPWWQAGHTWLRVSHDGHTLDVCAGRAGNRAGVVGFRPMTPPRPIHPWTRGSVSLATAPLVAAQGWAHLAGRPTPAWLYRGFDEEL